MNKQIITAGVGYDDLLADVRAVVLSALQAHTPTAPAAPVGEVEQVLDVHQAAALLGVTWQTVHEWKRRGLLPFNKLGGRTYFKRSEVLAALKNPAAAVGQRATARRGTGAAAKAKTEGRGTK